MINQVEAEQLRMEIAHIFESGANEIRIFEMVKSFTERQSQVNKLPIHNVSDLLIAWEQFKKANWWESESVDVEKVLMDKFSAIYGR
jgi:hypothetical protein